MEAQKLPVNIEDEMKSSYLDYAMSVIIGRALPDVRDGLKPVHRRILYSMHEMGLVWNKPFKKAARVVGEVLGKYHPHGDMAVYDALVRMVQDFSLRYPLVMGQGNFGSVDGDSPAAMRYTEVRLERITEELLADIDKQTVDFVPNFDGSLEEPAVLPAKLPNLLINGSSGIAVGMATNIPPHNIGEVIDGLIRLIDDPEISVDELMKHIRGPDFPTGAFIFGTQGIKEAYRTGRGLVRLRARAVVETHKDRDLIVVNELPYQVNKARLIEKIAELVRNKKIDGITDLRDESDREGMRIVIELKKGEVPQVVLNQLYKHTAMQSTFGVIMLALVDNRPRVLNLKELCLEYLRHRREVVTRRTRFELEKAEQRLHILEGLLKALEHLDAIIGLIRKSSSPDEARSALMTKYNFTQVQAQAILDMRLQRLTALERDKLKVEYEELLKSSERLRAILGNEALLMEVIRQELLELKEKYTDPRRTVIVEESAELDIEDLIAEEDMVVVVSHYGYIKRSALNLYRIQKRSGQGVRGITTKAEDFVEHLFVSSTHDYILFFTDAGKVYWLKVHEIPQAGRQAKGTAIVNLLRLGSEEKITAVLPLKGFSPDKFVVFATSRGLVKKTSLEAFSHPRPGGILAIGLEEGNRLISAKITDGRQRIFLGTRFGRAIYFAEDEVRPMGRSAQGVQGIKLLEGDEVVGMEVVADESATMLTVTENGFGKRTELGLYPMQHRAGQGVISIRVTEKNGNVVGINQVQADDSIMLITSSGTLIWMKVQDIPVFGRNSVGVRLQQLGAEDRVVAVAKLAEAEE